LLRLATTMPGTRLRASERLTIGPLERNASASTTARAAGASASARGLTEPVTSTGSSTTGAVD
jgi:hypothetical protein